MHRFALRHLVVVSLFPRAESRAPSEQARFSRNWFYLHLLHVLPILIGGKFPTPPKCFILSSW